MYIIVYTDRTLIGITTAGRQDCILDFCTNSSCPGTTLLTPLKGRFTVTATSKRECTISNQSSSTSSQMLNRRESDKLRQTVPAQPTRKHSAIKLRLQLELHSCIDHIFSQF
eukprot:scpid40983/ scgid9357/ 